jgi:hypothetical protein
MKVARAIAGAVGCEAREIGAAGDPGEADILFFGAAIHKGEFHESVSRFVANLDPRKIKRVAVFVTAFNEMAAESAQARIGSMLEGRRMEVAGRFSCRGKFLFFNRGRPKAAELEAAAGFARGLAGKD